MSYVKNIDYRWFFIFVREVNCFKVYEIVVLELFYF